MNSFFTKVKALLLLIGANPIFQWVVKVGRDSGTAYYLANTFVPTKSWFIGLGMAVASGLVHAFDIWLQQQVAASPNTIYNGPANVTPAASHLAVLKSRLKMVLLLIGVLGVFAGPAMAWDNLPAKPFGTLKTSVSLMGFPSGPELGGYLMPTANISMNPFADLGTPSYGYTIDEAFLIGRVSPTDASHVSFSNIVGVTAGLYFDLYPIIKTSGPLVAEGELGVIGPDMGTGIVPGIQKIWNFQDGSSQVLLNVNIPFGLFEDSTIVKVFGL